MVCSTELCYPFLRKRSAVPLENCKPPSGSKGAYVAAKIRQAVQPLGPTIVFKAYMDTSLEKQWENGCKSMPSELQSSGISLIHCPHNGGKEVADKMVIGTNSHQPSLAYR